MRDPLPIGVFRLLGLVFCLVVAGCNTRDVASGIDDMVGGRDGGTNVPPRDGWVLPDSPAPGDDDGGTPPDGCTMVSCSGSGLQYCGRIGDGCGGMQECGDCTNGQTCGGNGTPNVCPVPPGSCTAVTCTPAGGGRYCGRIGDGCGGTIECDVCPDGQMCGATGIPGLCATPPPTACQKLECSASGRRFCGRIGDSCGGALECGDCGAGETCGGSGTPGLCGAPIGNCTRLACNVPGGPLCGTVGDGCGGTLECGACPAGQTCGAVQPGVCAPDPASCTALTCNATGGPLCGIVGNGCGGTLNCPPCAAGQTCGAVQPGVCAPNPGSCTAITCVNSAGQYCGGTIGNGCGGALDCSAACPAADTCGGSGTPGVCGRGGAGGPCVNLECNRVVCPGTGKTRITGTVYDPAGKVPLYGAIVYVNNEPVAAFTDGVKCERCTDTLSGKPIATALTDTAGRFVLENVPVGQNIPLVIQVGKWRRQITVASVTACADTAVNPLLTRLPRNKAEGDIPLMALTTGGADPLECLLRKIGIADSEFTSATGNGRVHLYRGIGGTSSFAAGGALTTANNLWTTAGPTGLGRYDVVLLACEGQDHDYSNKPVTFNVFGPSLVDYTTAGGRVFTSHWHHMWLENAAVASQWRSTAVWNHARDLAPLITAKIDQSFPKGAALAQWLVSVGGSTVLGDIPIQAAQHTVDTNNTTLTQRWIYADGVRDDVGALVANTVQYFSFNTPIGQPEANQCGRVVNSDIHVSSSDTVNTPFPNGCTTTDLSPQEKVLEYMFFDIAACIRSDTTPPVILPPPPAAPPTAPPAPPAPPAAPPAAPPPAPPVAPPPPPVPPPPPPIVIN